MNSGQSLPVEFHSGVWTGTDFSESCILVEHTTDNDQPILQETRI